ncbi:hypothetical protein NKG05_21650 [Oerskovia sp. M15]
MGLLPDEELVTGGLPGAQVDDRWAAGLGGGGSCRVVDMVFLRGVAPGWHRRRTPTVTRTD